MPLPGEVSVATSWQSGEVSRGHSSWKTSRECECHIPEDSQTNEGLNVEKNEIQLGASLWE
jgi:hypothetical protein